MRLLILGTIHLKFQSGTVCFSFTTVVPSSGIVIEGVYQSDINSGKLLDFESASELKLEGKLNVYTNGEDNRLEDELSGTIPIGSVVKIRQTGSSGGIYVPDVFLNGKKLELLFEEADVKPSGYTKTFYFDTRARRSLTYLYK